MAAGKVKGYSSVQLALHWIVVALVAFQFLAHDAIEQAWRAYLRGEAAEAGTAALTYMHIANGMLILLLMLVRAWLRLTRGAPSPPADEPRLIQIAAEAVHGAIYLLLILLPVSGAVAWFAGIELAGEAHEILETILLAAIALHVAGALFQHFVFRSQVLMRMLEAERD